MSSFCLGEFTSHVPSRLRIFFAFRCSVSLSLRLSGTILKECNSSLFCNAWLVCFSMTQFVLSLYPFTPLLSLYVHVYFFVCVCLCLLGPHCTDFWQALLFSAVQLHIMKNFAPCVVVRSKDVALCATKHESVFV